MWMKTESLWKEELIFFVILFKILLPQFKAYAKHEICMYLTNYANILSINASFSRSKAQAKIYQNSRLKRKELYLLAWC